jgi:hypothetical protein
MPDDEIILKGFGQQESIKFDKESVCE